MNIFIHFFLFELLMLIEHYSQIFGFLYRYENFWTASWPTPTATIIARHQHHNTIATGRRHRFRLRLIRETEHFTLDTKPHFDANSIVSCRHRWGVCSGSGAFMARAKPVIESPLSAGTPVLIFLEDISCTGPILSRYLERLKCAETNPKVSLQGGRIIFQDSRRYLLLIINSALLTSDYFHCCLRLKRLKQILSKTLPTEKPHGRCV